MFIRRRNLTLWQARVVLFPSINSSGNSQPPIRPLFVQPHRIMSSMISWHQSMSSVLSRRFNIVELDVTIGSESPFPKLLTMLLSDIFHRGVGVREDLVKCLHVSFAEIAKVR